MKGIDILAFFSSNVSLAYVTRGVPRGWAIGMFDDQAAAWGSRNMLKLKRLLATNRYPMVRIQAHWSPQHKIVPIPKLKKKLPKYEALAKQFPDVHILVSHSCEYREHSEKAVNERIALIRQLAPSCTPICSIMEGYAPPDVIVEQHGDVYAAANEIISMDGTDFREIDCKHWVQKNKHALIQFGWRSEFNLRKLGETNPPPPDKRRVKPTLAQFKEVVKAIK